jgi:phosphoadenosine phosphosulfate reductase
MGLEQLTNPGGLAALAEQAGEALESAPATEIMRWAVHTFGDRLCVTSSMSDALVLHLAAQAAPGIDVIFLDTGYHFAETIAIREAVGAAYDVHVINVRPELTVPEQDATWGENLFARHPDLCCWLRKVTPLHRALRPYDAWVTGLRRDESPSRAGTNVVSWDAARGKVKICPIATWTQDDVDAYITEHRIPLNPLLTDGYTSVGCRPCTRRTVEGEATRAGRWPGFAKTECGLHR